MSLGGMGAPGSLLHPQLPLLGFYAKEAPSVTPCCSPPVAFLWSLSTIVFISRLCPYTGVTWSPGF